MTYTGIITGIDEVDKTRKFNILLYKRNSSGGWEYGAQSVYENALISAMYNKKITLANATLTTKPDGKAEIKGDPASFKRFEPSRFTGMRPIVIISEIRNSADSIIGYRVATYDCKVKAVRVKEIHALCQRSLMKDRELAAKAGKTPSFYPIQNAEFVPSNGTVREHIKPYVKGQFILEKMVSSPVKTAKPANVDEEGNKKRVSRLEEIFTKPQIEQLKLGKDAGVNYKIYGNNKLSPQQMEQIRLALMNNVDPTSFADPSFKPDSMKAYRINAKYGVDIRGFVNPEYTPAQISELSTAILNGIDIKTLADPSISADKMAKARIELESELWTETDVSVIDIINWT